MNKQERRKRLTEIARLAEVLTNSANTLACLSGKDKAAHADVKNATQELGTAFLKVTNATSEYFLRCQR